MTTSWPSPASGGAPIAQIAKDFGISESCLRNWLHRADVEDGHRARCDRRGVRGAAGAEAPQPAAGAGERGSPPRRGLLVAGEPAGKMMYPLVRELAGDGIPVTVTCRVLKLARQPYYRWLAHLSATGRERRRISWMRCSRRTEMTRNSATGCWPMRPGPRATWHVTGRCGGSAAGMAGGVSSDNDAAARPVSPAHPRTRTRSAATSPPRRPTGCGWPTSSATRRSRTLAVVGGHRGMPVAAGVWKLEDGRLPRRGGGWWSSPRQRRVVPVLPDGAGSASETERHTRGTSG